MSARRTTGGALAVGLATAGLSALPYLLASALAPAPERFSGFLLNPLDGFSYLAKMRQGADGGWLFRLPYALEPGPGALLYPYHLLLGHLSRLLAAEPLIVYHAARVLAAAVMFTLAAALYRRALPTARAAAWALALTLIGSGLGWLLLPFGRTAIDLWVPEAVPFLTAYANAHFPLASAALLAAILAALGPADGSPRLAARLAVSWLAWTVLALVQPFAIALLLITLAAWTAWESARAGALWMTAARPRVLALAAGGLGAAPWLLYDLQLTRTHPAIAGWAAQNLTPTPAPLDVLAGYAVVLALAAAGLRRRNPLRTAEGRLMLVWALAGAVLLYAPFGLQRRMALGLFFPLAALAGAGVEGLLERGRAARMLAILAFALALPSNLLVVGAGLAAAARGDPLLVLESGERATYEWIGAHLPAGATVLAGPESGNRLPAFADVRVLYGHPFETPDADAARAQAESLLAWDGPSPAARAELERLGLQFVLIGPREREAGTPAWLEGLQPLYAQAGFAVYRVGGP